MSVLITLSVLLVISLYSFWDQIKLFFQESFITKPDSDDQKLEIFFTKHFRYYTNLSPDDRDKFILRAARFIERKKFSGREGLEVTEEMKATIAGSAIQLTFGLEDYTFDDFEQIIVYPEAYRSTITGLKHVGEANPRGIIVLSWKDLKRGYSIPNDNFNVGLHEMAHALELQKTDNYFSNLYQYWKKNSLEEFEKLQNEEESFFRKYAGTNRHEFFAVCVEYFFESGEEFRKQLPRLYSSMTFLLNQDPLNPGMKISSDIYKSKEEILKDLQLKTPLFSSTNKLLKRSVNYIILATIVLIILANVYSKLFLLPLVYLIFPVVAALFRFKKIIIYEKFVVIQNQFFPDDIILHSFTNLISFSMNLTERKFSIKSFYDGRIIDKEYIIFCTREEMLSIYESFRNKKISSKYL